MTRDKVIQAISDRSRRDGWLTTDVVRHLMAGLVLDDAAYTEMLVQRARFTERARCAEIVRAEINQIDGHYTDRTVRKILEGVAKAIEEQGGEG